MKYTTKINGVDISAYIDDDGYETSVIPVWSRKITTLDGVDHVVKLRDKYAVKFRLRTITEENLATVSALLLDAPLTFEGRILQINDDVEATMIPDQLTAEFLSSFLYGNVDWDNANEIVLTSL